MRVYLRRNRTNNPSSVGGVLEIERSHQGAAMSGEEAYKRVGDMIKKAEVCRGLIGVIDVTEIMDYRKDDSMLLFSKQGFYDSEEYNKLLEWLGNQTNIYMRENLTEIPLGNKIKCAEVDASRKRAHSLVGKQCT